MTTDAIGWTASGGVHLLDQTQLPEQVTYRDVSALDDMIEAIRALRVRGAPLIGVAAAMGLAAAVGRTGMTREEFERAADRMAEARPTAVNLRWAVERVRRVAREAYASGGDVPALLRAEAQRIWDEDAAMCRAIGEAGAERIPSGATVMTHCNTGMLATGGIGTAAGAIYVAHEQGKGISVIACETRPLRQGARLTAWEMARRGVPCTVVVDGAAASVMASGEVDLVIVGADRIAANGDTANKIGTYSLAVLARAHSIPFYVAAPRSTFDLSIATGDDIPIEQRDGAEVNAAPGVQVHNPAFDVTPAELITGIVTDRGVVEPVSCDAITKLVAQE